MRSGAPRVGPDGGSGSGPAVARLFQRLFALVLLGAWLSLGSQVQLLIGSRGLLPAAEFFERTRGAGLGFWDEPSWLWLGHGDLVLGLGVACGGALALLALLGLWPRVCFALSAPLYLGFATVCDDFTAFQWDNMLVETALLAACLPADRPAPIAHFALRALLFKLYFESGIAKWQSHLHDWQDGSAMSFYYETAPLPAALAFHAHHLPAGWHTLESWGALVLELLVPFLIWAPHRARLCAFFAFSGFQLINTATANYGFFTYLSLVLHVFLLSDRDLAPLAAAIRARVPWLLPRPGEAAAAALGPPHRLRRAAAALGLSLWLAASSLSAVLALARFASPPRALAELQSLYAPLRLANVYHLFGHITRQRIEPQVETLAADGGWREHDLRYKPGAVDRPPPYVAPHQPRVDFRLWFYGLSFQRGMPRYVDTLLDRLCREPAAVQPLFGAPLPRDSQAVRLAFYRYRFASREQHALTGAYWSRERLGALPARRCD